MPDAMPDRDAIAEAHARITGAVRRTPVIEVDAADFGLAGLTPPLALKLEFLQHTGSFKPRGAFNTLRVHAPGPAGVTAASGGNHGAAVAFAARAMGASATIFVPEIASPVKVARIRSYGAEVRVGGARYHDALEASTAFAAATGALTVHAYDTPETVAGQGSVAREWEIEAGAPETVLVALGGGGLAAGMAAWWRGKVRIVTVEPEGSRCYAAAKAAGRPVDVPVESIAADSLGARRVGDLPFALLQAAAAEAVTVPDDAIRQAQRLLWDRLRAATEPGGAAAFAALLAGAYRPAADERVGVLVCGANGTGYDG